MNSKNYVCCPHCGWVTSYFIFIYARYDYPCPNCEKRTLSEFEDFVLYDNKKQERNE